MREDLWECRYLLGGLAILIFVCIAGVADGQSRRADFFEAHKCHDLTNGYVCQDGAVLQ